MTDVERHESPNGPPLDRLQRWFQTVVTHPGGVASGVAAAESQSILATAGIDAVALPSQHQSAAERLEVYARAYWARLLECLQEEFPILRKTVGDEAFDQFAVGYLQEFPSQSYTLARLSEQFPRYLADTLGAESAEPSDDFGRFVVELARFERAIDDVFDLEGGETLGFLSVEELSAVPFERCGELRLAPLPTFRLLEFPYDVNAFFTAARGDEASLPTPVCRPTFVALSRRGFVVRRTPLSRAPFMLLTALAGGLTLDEAVSQLLAALPEASDGAGEPINGETLRNWFAAWARAGFFRGLE